MNEADHKLKLRLVHEVLGALDIVDPGLSLGRGFFSYLVFSTQHDNLKTIKKNKK